MVKERIKPRIALDDPNKIPEPIMQSLEWVYGFGNHIDDYLEIRKHIISKTAPKFRRYFERRDRTNDLIKLNRLDQLIIEWWENNTGREVFIEEEKLYEKGKLAPRVIEYHNRKRNKQNS
ncbi:MAG: hypothetical protein WDA29_08745 [Flavobacteriaceae bacterium]